MLHTTIQFSHHEADQPEAGTRLTIVFCPILCHSFTLLQIKVTKIRSQQTLHYTCASCAPEQLRSVDDRAI